MFDLITEMRNAWWELLRIIASDDFRAILGNLFAITFATFAFWKAIQERRARRVKDKAISEKLESLERLEVKEKAAPPPETLIGSVRQNIEEASNSALASMLKTERRANSLYYRGSTLLMVSVLCPIVAAWLYWVIEPLSEDTILRLSALKKELGDLPSGIEVVGARDWRILAAGITFGFLCLAAAKGILNQQAKEMQHYFVVDERAQSLKRLLGAVDILEVAAGEDNEKQAAVATLVVTKLLAPTTPAGQESDEGRGSTDDQSEGLGSGISEIAKIVQGAMRGPSSPT